MDSSSRPHVEPLDPQAKVGFGRIEAQFPKCGEGLGLRVPGYSLASRKEASQKPAVICLSGRNRRI